MAFHYGALVDTFALQQSVMGSSPGLAFECALCAWMSSLRVHQSYPMIKKHDYEVNWSF